MATGSYRNTLRATLVELVGASEAPLSPRELVGVVRQQKPPLYGTESHHKSVESGSCSDLDHALKKDIYNIVRNCDEFFCDRSTTPLTVRLMDTEDAIDSELQNTDEEEVESESGYVYFLGTGLFTADGREVIKIGRTANSVDNRIQQLYTTSTPYRFRLIRVIESRHYEALERIFHLNFVQFRLNSAREFFSDAVLAYVDSIVELHTQITANN